MVEKKAGWLHAWNNSPAHQDTNKYSKSFVRCIYILLIFIIQRNKIFCQFSLRTKTVYVQLMCVKTEFSNKKDFLKRSYTMKKLKSILLILCCTAGIASARTVARFGVITDIHHTNKSDSATRKYSAIF